MWRWGFVGGNESMRARVVWVLFAMALVAACSGNTSGSNGSLPTAGSNGAQQMKTAGSAARPNDDGCGGGDWIHSNDDRGCQHELLLVPLKYDGSKFTLASQWNDCHHVWLHAPLYKAPTTGSFSAPASTTITPQCGSSGSSKAVTPHDRWWGHETPTPSPAPENLYIVAVHVCGSDYHNCDGDGGDRNRDRHDGARPNDGGGYGWWWCHHYWGHWWGWGVRANDHGHDDGEHCALTAVAGGPTTSSNPWTFTPVSPGLTTTAGSYYVFYVAILPSQNSTPPPPTPTPAPTPPPANVTLLAPLQFDGTNFSYPAGFTQSQCAYLSTGSAPVYTATQNAPFVLGFATASLAPMCSPGSGQVYIVAIQLDQAGPINLTPGWTLAIGGDASDDPWQFSPLSGQFSTVAGEQYAFFVGTLAAGGK